MHCPRCDTQLPPKASRCPCCKLWIWSCDSGSVDAEDRGVNTAAVKLSSKRTATIAKPRLDLDWLNPLFGAGGLVKTSTAMLAGSPGAGKSTLLQQIWKMALATNPAATVVAASAEECREESEDRAIRLGLTEEERGRVYIVDAFDGNYDLMGALEAHKPVLFTIDSLQKYCGRSNFAEQETFLHDCKMAAARYKAPCIIVSQVTKEDDIAGANANQHETDANYVLTKDGADVRWVEILKNRNGKTAVQFAMQMTETGLVPITLEEEE